MFYGIKKPNKTKQKTNETNPTPHCVSTFFFLRSTIKLCFAGGSASVIAFCLMRSNIFVC